MIELKETYDPPYNLWYGVKHKNLLRFKITYGGSLPNASALPPKALMPGVMFHMENDGSNYMWNGVAWDKMDSNPFVGATSSADGIQGLVPQPKKANREGFLYGGGGWKDLDASDVKTGVFNLARIPAAALERLVTVADQTERYALTTSTVQNGDTVLQSDTQIMYRVVDQTELDNSAGYVEYQAARASVVPWSGVTNAPDFALDNNVVHTTGDEIIEGTKTFSSRDLNKETWNNGAITQKSLNYTYDGTVPENSAYFLFHGADKNGKTYGWINVHHSNSGNSFSEIRTYAMYDPETPTSYGVRLYVNSTGAIKTWRPEETNTLSLGHSDHKWTAVYATTGTIQTSDERLKSNIKNYSDDLLDAWDEVKFINYQLNDSIREKGSDNARIHSGVTAQQVDSVFKKYNIDLNKYGFFCYDSWDAQKEERDDEGRIIEYARPAGNQYSIRYEELLCIEAAYQRRRAERAEARIKALEDRLEALEAKFA